MTTSLFDDQQPGHQKALGKLSNDQIGWLTTVRASGRPHSVPVWFLWHDGQVLIFSEEKTQKIRNLHHSGEVVFSLEAGQDGADVTILDGTAVISDQSAEAWLPSIGEVYATKYAQGLQGLRMTIDGMAAQFNQAIVITPTKVTAW